jgi:hypothetical protein
MGEPGGGPDFFTGAFERQVKEGSRNGACVCGSFVRDRGGRASLVGTVRDVQKKALESEHLYLYRDSIKGTWIGAFSLGILRDMLRKALEMECLSVCRGFMRGTWRDGFYSEDSRDM